MLIMQLHAEIVFFVLILLCYLARIFGDMVYHAPSIVYHAPRFIMHPQDMFLTTYLKTVLRVSFKISIRFEYLLSLGQKEDH